MIELDKNQDDCPYCHSDGSRLDNESIWGSKKIQELSGFDELIINLDKCELISTNGLYAFLIDYCPICGRKLGDDE